LYLRHCELFIAIPDYLQVNLSYNVLISTLSERNLIRLPEKVGAVCVEFIFGPLVENPFRLGGILRGPLEGLRSARRGSYRIIYRIEDDAQTIEIIHIDHRSNVYR